MVGKRRLRPEPKAPARWLPWAIAVVVVLALATGWLITSQASTAQDDKVIAEDQRDATAQQAGTLADQVAQACGAGGVTSEELNRVGACQQAEQVKIDPTPIPGPRGPGPTAEQIQAAVASYLAANPPPAGRAPTAAEVSTAVAQYLTANPPTPGRTPTAAEIAAAVATYFAANPPRNGSDGQPGRAPTPDEIQAAVNSYLAANPPPAGAAGPAGPPAPSVQTVTKSYSDGSTESCSRTGGTDTDPQFTCTTTAPEPPPDDPDEGGGLFNG